MMNEVNQRQSATNFDIIDQDGHIKGSVLLLKDPEPDANADTKILCIQCGETMHDKWLYCPMCGLPKKDNDLKNQTWVKCRTCSKRFNFEDHMQKVEDPNKKFAICPNCGGTVYEND